MKASLRLPTKSKFTLLNTKPLSFQRNIGRKFSHLSVQPKITQNFYTKRVNNNFNRNNISSFWFLGVGLALGAYLNQVNAEEEEEKEKEEEGEEQQQKQKQKEEKEGKEEEETKEEFNFDNKYGHNKENLPENMKIKYLIVGGGVSAFSAIKTIRSKDPEGSIMVISEEEYLPYTKPALSKEVWEDETFDTAATLRYVNYAGRNDSLLFREESYYDSEIKNTLFLTGTSAIDINPTRRLVAIDNEIQTIIEYEKCLIATGSRATLPDDISISPNALDKISTFNSINDFKKLDEITRREGGGEEKKIVVIGSTLLGSELANGLATRAKKRNNFSVHQFFPESGVLRDILPEYLSEFATKKLKEGGVHVHSNTKVTQITAEGDKIFIHLEGQSLPLSADFAVVATGMEANDKFARFGLEIDQKNGGILSSPELLARSNLFVAGDVASYFDTTFNKRRRWHSYDHALESGKQAALNMVSSDPPLPYVHLPMFWSSFNEVEMQGVGVLDGSLRTVSVWARPPNYEQLNENEYQNDYRKGLVYYFDSEDKMVGILLWGLTDTLRDKLASCRRVLRRNRKYSNLLHVQQAVIIEEYPESELSA